MENEKKVILEKSDKADKSFKYFYSIEDFPKFKILEENYQSLLNELLKVINNERSNKYQNNISFYQNNDLKLSEVSDKYHNSVNNIENENKEKNNYVEDNFNISHSSNKIIDNESHSIKLFEPWVEKNLYQDSNEEGWDVAPLMIGGVIIPERCEKFPFLLSLVKKINGVISVSYSLLKPGTHIVPHKGYDDYSEKMYRFHIGMIVPEGDIGIRVEKEIRKWEIGKSFVFDDFLIHEAWNFTTGNRIVLIIDFLKDETKLPNNIKFFDTNFTNSIKNYLNINENNN